MDRTVLLVDDDENVLRGLARSLRRQPYRLYTTRSADEAIAVLKARNVDVIVADERMPGMSGSDLLAWVADNYPHVVRIILTGRATIETAVRAINRGAVYQFLTKPCDEVHLAITIRKALEHRQLVEENCQLLRKTRDQLRSLERLSQKLEILTGIICRDLQKPLQTISRCCRSFEKEYHDLLDPKATTLLDNALDAAAEAQRLVADLRKQCRNKSPKPSETKEVSLGVLISPAGRRGPIDR